MNKQVSSAELDLKTGVPGGEIMGIEPHGDNTPQEQTPPTTTQNCENCGNGFEPHRGGKPQRFCSDSCRMAFHAGVREAGKAATQAKGATCTLVPPPLNLPKPETAPEPTGEDFDWARDDSVVLREQPMTAAYFNAHAELCIRQARWPDDDVFIYIAQNNIPDFLDNLARICSVPSH